MITGTAGQLQLWAHSFMITAMGCNQVEFVCWVGFCLVAAQEAVKGNACQMAHLNQGIYHAGP